MIEKQLLRNEITSSPFKKDENKNEKKEEKFYSIATLFSGPKAKKLFRKFVLLFIVLSYTAFGALIFQVLEYGQDIIHIQEVKLGLERSRSDFLQTVRAYSHHNDSYRLELNYELQASSGPPEEHELEFALGIYESQLESSLKAGVSTALLNVSEIEPRWSYTQSIFFAATVLTTIGYGNIAPGTDLGRIFCIAFALIGIPLTLTMIADMGEILASFLPTGTIKRILPKGRWRTVISITGIFGLLLTFIAFGGFLFICLEDWSFLDAFYFCFITTTTIGFGDLVPTPSSLLVCGVYILVGLALTSTVIEIVRRQYAASMERMRHLTMRIHQLSIPLAEAMRRMAETGSGEIELDTKLVRELQELNTALTEVQREEDKTEAEVKPEEDPWQALLDIATKKKRITVLMYESAV